MELSYWICQQKQDVKYFCNLVLGTFQWPVMFNPINTPVPTVPFAHKTRVFFVFCSFLSSIHEKANCIAIFWTGRPHSLGSCHFRGVWATCLPHKGGGVPLSALPKDTTSELAGLFSTSSHKCRAPSREVVDTIFKVFWYDSTRGMNP